MMNHQISIRKLIGCAMRIHSTLGNHFEKTIYQRALEVEMRHENISFESEKDLPVLYRGVSIGTRKADFLVDHGILVDIRTLDILEEEDFERAKNYLAANNLELGLLINFGGANLEFRRIYNQAKHHELMENVDTAEKVVRI